MNNMEYYLAEINVARMKGVNIDDPIMKEFVDNLDTVNALAEESEGFVWRLKDESNNATNLNPLSDEQILINVSIWTGIASLEQFVFKTFHSEFLKRRREWFTAYGKVYVAMWWIEKGKTPTMEEAISKLNDLEKKGASSGAFNFRTKFPKPNE